MKTVNYLVTDKNISVNFDNKTFVVSSSEKVKFDNLMELIQKQDEDGIRGLLVPRDAIIRYTNDYFIVTDSGKLYMKDRPREELPFIIADRLMDMITHKLPLEPLIKFWYNLRENPLESSKKSLYTFLEKHDLPITEEGNFVAYKKVDRIAGDNLVDNYTKKIDNSIGAVVKMPRAEVDADTSKACSTGLHVASLKYAKSFSGNVLLVVVVNPFNVVAVPKGEDDKMRVCEYKVVGIYEDTEVPTVNKDYDSKAILAKIPNDVPFDPDTATKYSNFEADIKIEVQKALDTKEVNLGDKTAKEIIAVTEGLTGEKIEMDPKYKQGILKRAQDILGKLGFNTK